MQDIPSFVVIDFETACYSKLSACSIGVALFEAGSLTESRQWLLKPIDEGKWSFSKIHGLTHQDCKNQATIKDIWYELEGYLNNKFIVAHNAIFDMTVLKESLEYYGIEYKNYHYGCTKNLATAYFPYLNNNSLKNICEFLNIEYGEHDAERDAVSTGEVFLKMIKFSALPEILFDGNQLEKKSYLTDTSFLNKFKSNVKASLDGLEVNDVDGTATLDFFRNKKCLVTGEFETMDRYEILDKIKYYGGQITSSVIKSLDYFIIGEMPGYMKIEKVKELKASGREITIMDESEFLQVLEKIKSLS